MNQPEKRPKKVLAGPFVGEFGWELFCWQGFLRKIRSNFDYMTVISRTGREILYKDFADEFIPHEIPFDQTNMWINRGVIPQDIVSYYDDGSYTDYIPFDRYKSRWWVGPKAQTRQKFVPFGGGRPEHRPVDILVHIRDAHHCDTKFRNWYADSAMEYVMWAIQQGFSVACVGKKGTSWALLTDQGVFDYRDLPLYEEANVFAASRVIIGSQSGPHHFAMLCRLPVIAWQTKPEHAVRLTKHWNPFNVKTWVNHPNNNSYWDNKTKNTKHWQPELKWMQRCTLEALKK